MKEQIEQVLAEVASNGSDRRMNLFQVQVHSVEPGLVKLRGRVLDASNLKSLRDAMPVRLPGLKVDDSAIQVLRRDPAVLRAVVANVTGLHAEPSFLSEMLTQVLNGTALEILEETDTWCYVRQADGYLGWAYKGYLADLPAISPTHLVCMPTTRIFSGPEVTNTPASCLVMGTNVRVVEERGAWSRIEPVGKVLPGGWVAGGDLRSVAKLPLSPADARTQMIADARKLAGVPYLWGGCAGFGIDCSGMAQLVHRLAGYTIPRDADAQHPAGRPVEGPYQAGDLFYFGGENSSRKITHVGISLGGWKMIHSSRSLNGVYEEDVQANERLARTFVGAKIFVDRA